MSTQNPAKSTQIRRQKKGLSQRELAVLAGVSKITVGRIERGEPVSLRTLGRVAKALGTTPGQLLRAPRQTPGGAQ